MAQLKSRRLPVLRASPESIEAMNAKLREAEEAAARRRADEAREKQARATVRVVAPAPAPDRAPALAVAPKPERQPSPALAWSGQTPIVLPDGIEHLSGRQRLRTDEALRAIARLAPTKPGEARRVAVKLEAYLGVTADDRVAAWRHVRVLIDGLGAPALTADLAELSGQKPKRQRGQATKAKKAAKKLDAKYSDGPTKERAKKSRLIEEPIYSVEAVDAGPKGKDREPKRILVGRAMRDKNLDPKVRLERFRALETQHVNAGVRFATDWDNSGLEPSLTVNLLATGRGTSADAWSARLNDKVMRARDSLHAAIRALSVAGPDVVHVVEAVVLKGESATVAASNTYSDRPRASAHVASNLKVGLNILSLHYNSARRSRRDDDARDEQA